MSRLLYFLYLLGFICVGTTVSIAEPPEQAPSSYLNQLIAEARYQQLADAATWRNLLHYDRSLISKSGYRSEADGEKFFLAPDGKTNPEVELIATLRGIAGPPLRETLKQQHVQCQFPARYRWLKERLQIDDTRVVPQPCPRWQDWRQNINAGGATLVFAAAYMNNPASMYGHTFIRIDKAGRPATDLLAYIFNYSATMTSLNPVVYSIMGLTGGFNGYFAIIPYYLKVEEYSAMERRDLWEYRLKLRQDQIDMIVAHAWELGSTYFDYFYLDENCSYHILSLLQIVDPDLQFRRFHRWVTIPSETISTVLRRPGLVDSIKFRPSLRRRMQAMQRLLSSDERQLAAQIADRNDEARYGDLDRHSPMRRALILDAALLRKEFRQKSKQAATGKTADTVIGMQVKRAMTGVVIDEPPIAPPAPPQHSHDTAMLALGFGANRMTTFSELWWRSALQDLLADNTGLTPSEQIEMISLKFRFDHRGHVEPELFDFVNIISLAPLETWDSRASWHLRIGALIPHEDLPQDDSSHWRHITFSASGGPGIAAQTNLWGKQIWFALSRFSLAIGDPFAHDVRLTAGGTMGVQLEPSRHWRLLAEFAPRASYYFDGTARFDYEITAGQSFTLDRNIELRMNWRRLNHLYDEGLVMVGIYY